MKLEHRPASGSTYRGWQIPKPTPGYKSLDGQQMVTYWCPNSKNPAFSDQIIVVQEPPPVPQWIFPSRAIKALAPGIVHGLHKDLKTKVFDKWSELEFQRLIDADRNGFYQQVASLSSTS